MHIHVHDQFILSLSLLIFITGFGKRFETRAKKRPKMDYLYPGGTILLALGWLLSAVGLPRIGTVSTVVLILGIALIVVDIVYSEVKRALAGEKERGTI